MSGFIFTSQIKGLLYFLLDVTSWNSIILEPDDSTPPMLYKHTLFYNYFHIACCHKKKICIVESIAGRVISTVEVSP